jgi:hypothetical protein
MRREDQDFGRRCCTFNLSRRFETMELRHLEAEDRNVGDELLHQGNGLAPSHRLATDLPARMLIEQVTEAAANEVVIIGYKNTQQVSPPNEGAATQAIFSTDPSRRASSTRYDVIVRRTCKTSGEFLMERDSRQ